MGWKKIKKKVQSKDEMGLVCDIENVQVHTRPNILRYQFCLQWLINTRRKSPQTNVGLTKVVKD